MHAARKINASHPSSRSASPLSENLTKDDLLILAANRFCGEANHDRLSADQFKEAFYLLVGSCSNLTKQFVGQALANCIYTPRSIVMFLALEPLEISISVLAKSPVIGQLDMMQIMEMKGTGHAAVIATRPDIGPSVVKRLKEFDHPTIDEALKENGALVDDASDRSAEALFNAINKQPVETAQKTDRDTQQPSRKQDHSAAEQSLLSAAKRGGRIETVRETTTTHEPFDFGEALEKSARVRSHQGMAVLMQKKMGLSLDTAQQVLSDKSGDTFSVLMRAGEVDPAQANRILLLTFPSIGLDTQNAMRSIRFYERLQVESCQLAVAEWPKSDPLPASHQPYMDEGRMVGTRVETRSVPAPHENHQSAATLPGLKATG